MSECSERPYGVSRQRDAQSTSKFSHILDLRPVSAHNVTVLKKSIDESHTNEEKVVGSENKIG